MVEVKLNKTTEDFRIFQEYTDSTGESADGMRKGCSFHVKAETHFCFKNERQDDGAVVYDLEALRTEVATYGRTTRDLTKDAESFLKNFSFISECLWMKGLFMRNYPGYATLTTKAGHVISLEDGTEAYGIELQMSTFVSLAREGDYVTSATEVINRINQFECSKDGMIAIAMDDSTFFVGEYKVALDSVPEDLRQSPKQLIKLPKQYNLMSLRSQGIVTDDELRNYIKGFIDRMEKVRCFRPMALSGLEDIVLSLPEAQKKAYLRRCLQDSQNLDFFREHCPEGIDWREVPLAEMRDSDLDLMIEKREYAYTPDQWKFIDHCMEIPNLERKVASNAYMLGKCDLGHVVRQLRTATTTDILRSACRELGEERRKEISLSELKALFGIKFANLEEADYRAWLSIIRRLKIHYLGDQNDAAAFLLRIGSVAKVSETELTRMLQKERFAGQRIELCDSCLCKAYTELNFAPGLVWMKADKEQQEAEARRKAEKRAQSNESVVKFVCASGKIATCVISKDCGPDKGDRKICRCEDGKEIGILNADEKRVLFVEGGRNDYLININRAKNVRHGILHIDILEEDAGYVIGPRGSKLRETEQRLRDLGCPVQTIRLHKHATF